jgi:hypothetical protein
MTAEEVQRLKEMAKYSKSAEEELKNLKEQLK